MGNSLVLQMGNWVLVAYDAERFPGEVTNISNSETDIEVNVMHRCGSGNVWKWPKKLL